MGTISNMIIGIVILSIMFFSAYGFWYVAAGDNGKNQSLSGLDALNTTMQNTIGDMGNLTVGMKHEVDTNQSRTGIGGLNDVASALGTVWTGLRMSFGLVTSAPIFIHNMLGAFLIVIGIPGFVLMAIEMIVAIVLVFAIINFLQRLQKV